MQQYPKQAAWDRKYKNLGRKIMFRIAVCDDEKIDRKVIMSMIEKYIEKYHIECDTKEFDSADGLIGGISDSNSEEMPDILFLDIFMSGMNGIELAKKLRSENVNSDIVFITSSNEYAADAFEVDAFSYLRKPLEEEKFYELMDRIMGHFTKTRTVEVNCERIPESIYISDIVSIETSGRQLIIHTIGKDYCVYMSIAGLLRMLPQTDFVQISRFEAISMEYIKMMSEKEVTMDNDTVLLMSPRLAGHISERYDEYRRRNG